VGKVVGLQERVDIHAINCVMLDHIRLAPSYNTSFAFVASRPRQESVLARHQMAAGAVVSHVVKY